MSTDTYYEDDVDSPMVIDRDESSRFEYPRPQPRPSRYGPTNRDDLDVDYDYEEEAQRSGGVNYQALTGFFIVGTGAASLIWVFAGPIVLVSVAGAGVLAAVGRKVVSWRRNRNRNGNGNGGGRNWFKRNRNGQGQPGGKKKGLGGLGKLFGGGGKAAAARRAGLLNGMGSGGLGGGRGRGRGRNGGGPGGGGGRGPRGGGPRGPKPGGGVKPKSGGGLLGRIKPKGKGKGSVTGGAKSGGVTPKRSGPGKHRGPANRAGSPLTRIMPGPKGRAARLAHQKAKAAKATAAKKARQAKRDNTQHKAAKKDFRAKMKQARFQRRQLKRKNRTIRRRYRRQNPGFMRRSLYDFFRGLRSIGTVVVGGPVWFLPRFVYGRVLRPVGSRLFIPPSLKLAAWAGRVSRGRRRAWMLRRRYNAIYRRPARRAWAAQRWADFKAWVAPAWFLRLRQLAASRGRWVAALGLLVLMLAGIVFAARKAREWAWDGKKARSVFDPPEPTQQNTDPNQPDPQQAQPDPQQAQPDPQQAQPDPNQPDPQQGQPDPNQPDPQQGQPDPNQPDRPEPRGNPWGYQPATTSGPAPGTVPNTTEGAPQMSMLTEQPGTQLNDNLEIPAGLHPTFAALAADARTLEGMFDPASFPDLAIYLNSLGAKMRYERDKWATVGDQLLSQFPGFNLAQEFAGEVQTAYSDLARRADDVFQGFRDKEEQTFARWLDPRVNEEYADVTRWPGVSDIDPITLVDGSKMHGSHTIWLTSFDLNMVGWFPDKGENNDYVIELLHWLQSIHPFFIARAKYAKNFVENGLVHSFPIEDGVADITMQIARGFADLADRGYALATGYEQRNPYDMNRRYEPKVNEHKRDRGNSQMTNAGA